jgi:hypothetical protein
LLPAYVGFSTPALLYAATYSVQIVFLKYLKDVWLVLQLIAFRVAPALSFYIPIFFILNILHEFFHRLQA